MKKLAFVALSAALLASSSAFAQGVTRAEVQQQLVQAEQNGSRLVTDASYPDVAPIDQNQLAQQKPVTSAYGGMASGSAASGTRIPMTTGSNASCVGPRTFCDTYAGS
jgi:opacity protein-like surface antigen